MLKKYYKKVIYVCYGFVYGSCKPELASATLLRNTKSLLYREVWYLLSVPEGV